MYKPYSLYFTYEQSHAMHNRKHHKKHQNFAHCTHPPSPSEKKKRRKHTYLSANSRKAERDSKTSRSHIHTKHPQTSQEHPATITKGQCSPSRVARVLQYRNSTSHHIYEEIRIQRINRQNTSLESLYLTAPCHVHSNHVSFCRCHRHSLRVHTTALTHPAA